MVEPDRVIRILQVGMSPYYGGTESFIMNQYCEIDRTKIQFDFLNVYQREIACQKKIVAMGGNIYYLDMARNHGIRGYHKNLDDFFFEHAAKFDAVHCHFQSLINIDILRYAKKYDIKVRIAHAHNSGYGTEPSLLQKSLIACNKIMLNSYATHYFACSKLAANWMFHREAVIINNAIDAAKFKYNEEIRNSIRHQMGLDKSRVVMFVGRLDSQKNPFFLLEIFNEIHKKWTDAKLLIIGDGVLRPNVEQRISQLALSDSVQLLGSRSDVNELLQVADIFLFPSKFEGLGIALIEAQAAGVVTYTSKDVVPRDVKVTGLLDFISLEKSASEWAERIVSHPIEEHKDTLQEIRRAGYDNKENAQRLQKLYLNMMEKLQ